MNKMKKLLSVLLAMVMMLSCFSVAGSAFQEYENPGEYYYDSNDNPRVYLYTAEQRASIIMDMLDELLLGLNINMSVLGVDVDLRSYDALCSTLDHWLISTALNVGGHLADFEHGALDGNTRSGLGDVGALDSLLECVGDNRTMIYNIINDGKIDLGTIGSLGNIDLSGVNVYLEDLVSLIGGLIYGLQDRQMTNGIGEDTATGLGNDPLWDDMTADEKNANWTLDTMVENLVLNLLTKPRNTIRITDRSQNSLGSQAIEELQEDGVTYNYYCYGVDKDGNLKTTGEEADKQYLTRWDPNSALLKGVSGERFAAAFDLQGKDLYTLLEDVIAWAYDAFGGHNLDGQLRATLMQFCGAYNNAADIDDATKETLKAKMDAYKALEDNANSDKQVLRDEFANTTGVAGNYNFMYISLSGADINTQPDDLYYVVEWDQSYQYYHVEFNENDMSNFFGLIDWEYQAPMWSELMTTVGWTSGTSILNHINDIVGEIITTAVTGLTWTAGTGDNALVGNVTNLIKYVIKNDTVKLFGSTFELPADFDSYDLEDALVMIADIVIVDLMPALILPEDVSSVEEIMAYALREVMADLLPHTGSSWDSALANASTEDDYLAVALNMAVSCGVYYLQNLIGLGTKSTASETTSVTDASNVPLDGTTTWQYKFNYIVDWVISTYVPTLTTNIKSNYSAAFSGSDGLLKLSAVLSGLFPTLAKTIGANDDTYAINLNTIYDDLRAALNGDFSGLGNGLERKASGTAGNQSAVAAIATLIQELFGGLGMSKADNWSTIQGYFTTALNTSTPIQSLLGAYGTRTTLANLLSDVVTALGKVRAYFLQDAVMFIHMLTGYESTFQNNGVTIDGVENAYTGSTSFTIDYSFMLNVAGVREYFNDGTYKSGTGYFDGEYSLQIVSAKVVDSNGNTKGSATYGTTTAPNEKVALSIGFSGVAETPSVYTLEVTYKIKTPAETDFSGSEAVVYEKSFIATSLMNDSITPTYQTYTDSYDTSYTKSGDTLQTAVTSANIQYGYTNAYVSEVQSLRDATAATLTVIDNTTETITGEATYHHTMAKAWILDYGYNITNDDGTISINTASDGSGSVPDLSSRLVITENGTSVAPNDAWFKWDINTKAPATYADADGSADGAKVSSPLWTVEDDNYRGEWTADYTVYKIDVTISISYDFTQCGDEQSTGTDDNTDVGKFTTYITLYNSYDLSNRLNSNLGLDAEDYDTTAGAAEWAEYQAALEYAMTQMYGNWTAATFEADHTVNVSSITVPVQADGTEYEGYDASTVSAFKYAGDRLEAAVAALADYKAEDAEESAAIIDPSNAASPYNAIYNAVKEMQAKDTSNHNYALYTWFRYNDEYQALKNAINALTVPSQTAPNTLIGVNSTSNDIIDAVVAQIQGEDANIGGVVAGLVEAPTAEATQAAIDAYNAFAEGYDAVVAANDPAILNSKIATMKIYGTDNRTVTVSNQGRLLPKYSAQQMYFLNDAITTYGNEAAADYSEGSYAVYHEALTEAKAIQADSSATQYEIFSARYHLLVAYKALIRVDEDIDLTALKAVLAEAQAIFDAKGTENELGLAADATVATLEEAYEQLLLAMGYEVTYTDEYGNEVTSYIGGEYTGAYAVSQEGKLLKVKKQGWVDEITARVQTAVDNFASAMEPSTLMVQEDYAYADYVVIDTNNTNNGEYTGIVYGIDTLDQNMYLEVLGTLDDALTTSNGDDYLVIEANEQGVESTGATITVVDENGDALETYVFVYFGDIDGDGMITGSDGYIASEYEMTYEGIESYASYVAGDVDSDGMVSGGDGYIMSEYEMSYEGVDYQYNLALVVAENGYVYEWIY